MIDLSDEELTAILDALAAQPLAKVYNLFNKLLAEAQRRKQPPPQPAPIED